MGNSSSSPAPEAAQQQQAPAQGVCPVNHGAAGAAAPASGECPVKHTAPAGEAQSGGCPVKHTAPASDAQSGGCPVKHTDASGNVVYNVYAQPIDPTNRMPLNPNQLPAPGQTKELSTDRVRSHIPKGGTDGETWEYPSPQMFYNAMLRKGKLEDDVDEDDVATIVAVHNNMNEKTWNMVVNWEQAMHPEDFKASNGIKLTRFMGRPDDISPMAWFKSTFMGYPRPFDRHDWIVDRNGTEVRYIIDYYYDESKSSQDETPTLHDAKSIRSITMDARPALDSPQSLFDRIRYPVLERMGQLPGQAALGSSASPAQASQEAAPLPEGSTSFEHMDMHDLKTASDLIGPACKACFAKVDQCSSEAECQQASVALTYCMAELVCAKEAARYKADLNSEEKLDDMVSCMGRFEAKAMEIRAAAAAAAEKKE